MKSVYYRDYGPAENLIYDDSQQVPEPGAGEVLVKVAYSSVNPIDWKIRSGAMKMILKISLPFITGSDFAGTIAKVGPGVTAFAPGDLVFGQNPAGIAGAAAEYCKSQVGHLIKRPEALTAKDAAAIPLAGQTAYQALQSACRLQAQERLLIIGGSTAVGMAAIQIARAIGAEVSVVCSGKKKPLMLELGAHEVIDYKTTDFRQDRSSRYDAIFDCVGADSPFTIKHLLRKQGRFATVAPHGRRLWEVLLVSRLLNRFGMMPATTLVMLQSSQDKLTALLQLWQAGKFTIVHDRTYKLAELKAAHEYSQTGRAQGKITIEI